MDQLIGMNSSMREFSCNVEDKLKKAYKTGNYTKKFGYDQLSNPSNKNSGQRSLVDDDHQYLTS